MTALAAYTTPPIARRGPTDCHSASSGSMRGSRRPSRAPGSAWKYHQGMPFITNATGVSGPSNGPMPAATAGKAGAFTVTTTASCGPKAAGSSLARTRLRSSPAPVCTVSPLCWIAARCGPRASTDTSAPPRA